MIHTAYDVMKEFLITDAELVGQYGIVAFLIITILKPSISFICFVTFIPKINDFFRFFFRAANICGSNAGDLQGK